MDTNPNDVQDTTSESPAPETVAATDAASPESDASQRRSAKQPSMSQVMESDEWSEYLSGADQLSRNALLTGIVAHIDENTGVVLVDIGSKSEGIIRKNETGDEEIKVGDQIEVVVVQPEDEEGHPVLSKRRADYERLWRSIAVARDENTTLQATVIREVKGGLIVDLGVSAFIPASHVSTRSRSNLGHMVGRTIPVRVIEVERKKDKVIASHRLAADEERKAREEEAWTKIKKDEIVEGTVRRITDFGAFVDIGGIDGLLHVREMAWGRVEHPEHIVKKGQKLQVLILDIDEDREPKRVALGLKQLQSDPWKKAASKYRTGQMVTGKITHIAPSCAFVELEDGIEAIIPISEMSEERIKTPEDVVQVNQDVEARIKTVQPGQRKITLSLRAAARDKERRETREAIREVNQRATGGDSGPVRLGDIFGEQLREARERTKDRNRGRDTAKTRAQRLAEEEEWDGVEDLDEIEDVVVEEGAPEEVDEVVASTDADAEVVASTDADAEVSADAEEDSQEADAPASEDAPAAEEESA